MVIVGVWLRLSVFDSEYCVVENVLLGGEVCVWWRMLLFNGICGVWWTIKKINTIK